MRSAKGRRLPRLEGGRRDRGDLLAAARGHAQEGTGVRDHLGEAAHPPRPPWQDAAARRAARRAGRSRRVDVVPAG
eukprot:7386153-Prymnesium_polylepis.2